MSYTVDAWHGGGGTFRTKKAAQEHAKRLREANAQAGNKGPVRVKKINPAVSVKAVRVKNFTGTITKLPNGQVKVTGKAKK